MEIERERTINHGDSSVLKVSADFCGTCILRFRAVFKIASSCAPDLVGMALACPGTCSNSDERQVKPRSKNTLKLSLKIFEGLFNLSCTCVQLRKMKPDEAMDHFDLAYPWHVKCCICVWQNLEKLNQKFRWVGSVPAVEDEHEVDLLIFRRGSSLGLQTSAAQRETQRSICRSVQHFTKFHTILPYLPLNL